MDSDRTEQLSLLADDPVIGRRRGTGWRLDDATRARGRQGVAAARQALLDAAARRVAADGDHSCAA